MNTLVSSAPLLLRRRGALADVLPVIAFAAAGGILATVLGGLGAFLTRAAGAGDLSAATEMDPEAQLSGFLVICAIIACVLLVPTAIGLGGSAARLSLSRREKDLATMRLVGATTSQVGILAVADVAAQALLGTVIGIGLHLAVTPALTALDFGITPFTFAELVLPIWGYPLLLLGIVLLAAGSAAIALTGIAVTPLGVARDSRNVRMSVIRVLVWVALIGAFLVVIQFQGALAMQGMGVVVAVFGGFMALILGGINVIGPFVVWLCARALAAIAPTASLMVGARRLAADPRSGWRAVSGITFALVIAGFLTVITMFDDGSTDPFQAMMNQALQTGGLLTLVIAAILAAVSTGVTQTARVIDQAPVLHSQHISGAQVGQLYRARIAEIALPLVLSALVAGLTALVLLAPLLSGGASMGLMPVVLFLVAVIAAYALVLASVLVASPLVRRAALTTA